MVLGRNLVGQEPWELRGANDARIAALETRLATAEVALDNAEALLRMSGATYIAAPGTGGHGFFNDWYGGTAEVSFTKLRADTLLQVTYWTSFFVDTPLGVEIAIKNMTSGVDHEINLNHFINTPNAHQFFGGVITPSDTAPGAYTYRFRQRVSVNAGAISVDANDAVQMTIREVLP